jgi:5-methylcytosine-specific restriction enzyme subunit McrC
MPQVIEIAEYGTAYVPQSELKRWDIERIRKRGVFEIARSFDGDNFELAVQGFVGQVPINDRLTIRIHPKLPVSNLFWMLDIVYKLDAFDTWDESLTSIGSIDDLFERLGSILAHRTSRRIQRGLYKNYIGISDDLEVVRGRINVAESMLRLSASPRLACEFQEHSADLVENQIVLFALDLIARSNIRNEISAGAVRRARQSLVSGVRLIPFNSSACVNRRYNRLNDDYRALHALSRFFIDHIGPSFIEGSHDVLPFVVDMPKLFETFVAEWLSANAPAELEISPQYTLNMKANVELQLRVDLVVKRRATGQVLAVMDTKYKNDERPSTSDVSQIALYAHETGAAKAILVYPKPLAQQLRASSKNVEIRSISLDLSQLPRPNCDVFLSELLSELA